MATNTTKVLLEDLTRAQAALAAKLRPAGSVVDHSTGEARPVSTAAGRPIHEEER